MHCVEAGRLVIEGQRTGNANLNPAELRVGLNLDPPVVANWTPSGFVAAAGPLIFELPSSAVPADGSLLFKGVAKGDYRVSVVEAAKTLENAYVKSIRFGTADV